MKAAHFLLLPELAQSPPNEAIISTLLELGCEVDLFAPGTGVGECGYGPRVRMHKVEYGKRWLIRNITGRRWSKYACLSGTSEDPLGTVGFLSFVHRRPSFILADEIKSEQYRGDSPESWKRLCKWAMRRGRFQIVNDQSRVALQREYCGARQQQEILVYPGCFRSPPPAADRSDLRKKWGFTESDLVVGFSGGFNLTAGADWLIASVQGDKSVYVVVQPINVDPIIKLLLRRIGGRERVYVEEQRLSWSEAWAEAACFDIGVCVYRNPAPQFQHMGTSSNRLCMFLSMGVPVIASRQSSFQFIEDYDCGILVDNEAEFVAAIDRIRDRLELMKANALRCAQEYIDAPGKYFVLRDAIARVVNLKP